MRNIIATIFLLSICFSAKAEKTYTPQQLHSMIDSDQYPKPGAVITQTKAMAFDNCVTSLSVITSSIIAHYPIKNTVTTDSEQSIKFWTNDSVSTFTCLNNSSQVIITNAPYI